MLYLVLLHYELSKSLLWNGEYWVFLVYVTLGQKSFPQICNKPTLTALNDLQRLWISAHVYDKEDIMESVCALNALWVCHYVRLVWLTPIPTLFPHSCPHKTAPLVASRHHQLWNLAGSSAGADTGGYVNSTTKQLPSPLGWRPGMTWVSPTGLVPLGSTVSPCQTPGLALYCWCEGLCQQDEAFHCMTAECKALRQRQQKACSVSENTADRRKHPPEEEEVTQRQKL